MIVRFNQWPTAENMEIGLGRHRGNSNLSANHYVKVGDRVTGNLSALILFFSQICSFWWLEELPFSAEASLEQLAQAVQRQHK